MKEITFTVDGVDGEFVCDADELKSYKTAKQLARADEDFSLSFDVMERVFMGRDEEYIERLGGSVDRLNDLLAAALDAVGEDAKTRRLRLRPRSPQRRSNSGFPAVLRHRPPVGGRAAGL